MASQARRQRRLEQRLYLKIEQDYIKRINKMTPEQKEKAREGYNEMIKKQQDNGKGLQIV
jgi:lipopolysaccharide biosynthesis regulator YciM